MNSDKNNLEEVVIEDQFMAGAPAGESDLMVAADAAADEPEMDAVPEVEDPIIALEAAPSSTAHSGSTDEQPDEPKSTEKPAVDNNVAESTDPTTGDAPIEPGEPDEPEFDSLRTLTELLLGGAIEGTSQLISRLKAYQAELQRQADEREAGQQEPDSMISQENELDRLRFAVVGLILDAQSTFKRNVSLWARIADRSVRTTNRVAGPVTNSFLFGPLQRRYDRLVRRGEESLARWVADGRTAEPHSRELAKMTYLEIVDEFINRLAENPELESLITQQSLGLASEARDEVRERTVTADNLVESLVRRVLRRTPRAELPGPPPEVQRWASMTLEDFKVEKRPKETDS